MKSPFSGLVVPMITPFDGLGRPAADRAIRFGTDLLNNGVNGLALFGTTSEGQSLSASERMDLLDAMIAGGIESAMRSNASAVASCCCHPTSMKR